jgi:hypothetical protein
MNDAMSGNARVVLMVVDGLRADTLDTEWMPSLSRLAERSRRYVAHRGVFPSATRVSSASIATGCQPAKHGLAGNAICWDEGAGLEAVSVGPVTFRERWREVTGNTLHVPTLAERMTDHGGMLIYSNSSPGAAHMQDPDGHATFFHRSGSWGPGFSAAQGSLDVTYDGTGDAITVARFCDALLHGPRHPMNLTWICEPDHSQHALELGGAGHQAVLAGSDRLIAQVSDTVERLRSAGEQVLFIVASDHGQETTDQIIDVEAALVGADLKQSLDSRDMVVASSGMGGLIYTASHCAATPADIADFLRGEDWCREAWSGNALAMVGQRSTGGLAVAFAMAGRDEPNVNGVMGFAHVMKDPFSPADSRGLGQHGGLGPYEGAPALLVDGDGFDVGHDTAATSLVDIAPTALAHLGLATDAMDGRALQGLSRAAGQIK